MNPSRLPLAAVLCWLPILVLTAPASAPAHTGLTPTTSWGYGLLHPLTGLDHLLAAVGVGLWAALQAHVLARRLLFVFLSMLLVGLPLGAAWPTETTEWSVLASVLLLGTILVLVSRPPAAVSLLLIALFGLLHGHVHGTEILPETGWAYALGWMLATGLLTFTGYAIGRLLHHRQLVGVFRLAGFMLIGAMIALL